MPAGLHHLDGRPVSRPEPGDCYLSLTHSEEWGLGAFDAAGIGNPVVITGWGGHLDFLGADYFGLVDHRLTAVRDRRGNGSYEINQNWAQANREHAVQLMRDIISNPGAVRPIATQVRDRIRTDFSEAAVISRLIEAIT